MQNFIKLNLIVSILLLHTFSAFGQINPQFIPIPASYNVNSPNPIFAQDINPYLLRVVPLEHLYLTTLFITFYTSYMSIITNVYKDVHLGFIIKCTQN